MQVPARSKADDLHGHTSTLMLGSLIKQSIRRLQPPLLVALTLQ